ncbi:MAG: hypothetical protein QNJ85_11745 [Gammaproteobacteria bacterium]|nr:hypothetical protein [Gammaproteobacteria bacterium]
MASRWQRTLFYAAGLPLLAGLLGGGYWLFLHDPEPVDAIAFFYPAPGIAIEDNAAWTIAGLAAPAGMADFRPWGYQQVLHNRERAREGDTPLPLLGSYAGSRQISSLAGVDRRRLYCWLPDPALLSRSADCYSRAELDDILRRNRERLERYASLFTYATLDNPAYYGIDLADLLVFSDLYRLRLWLARERLSAADLGEVFAYFRFWEGLARRAEVDVNNRLMLLLHYRKASALLAALSERDPSVLLRYHAVHGRFDEPGDGREFLDRALRGEYFRLDRQLCLSRALGQDGDCLVDGRRFRGKLGEFLRRIHARRVAPGQCAAEIASQSGPIERFDFWQTLLRDPANISGNILLTTVASPADLCRLWRDYLLEAEAGRWRNRFVEMALAPGARGPSTTLFSGDLTGNRFLWDAGGGRLRWLNRQFVRDYSLRLDGVAAE